MRADSKHRSVGDCVEPYDTNKVKMSNTGGSC